jgi:quinol monooxygenase YgiN
MYGLIGKIDVIPGQRDALAAILLNTVSGMPGCHSYVVAYEPDDPDVLWVTEVWESKESHTASLALPSVLSAIREGQPMIGGYSQRVETQPVGGFGLDGTHRELSGLGAHVVEPPEDKPWGMRQFTVEDLDGNRFHFHCD